MARTIRAVVLIFTIVAKGAFAQGSEYPTRPVKIIVPYAPAGPADVVAAFSFCRALVLMIGSKRSKQCPAKSIFL
jgi:tripartite-type tricarboxylate transporter receptor subunit TctC